MTYIRIANAPCSWGTLEFEGLEGKQIPYGQMLDELRETGYVGTELGDWGYMPTNPAVLREELEKRNLAMVGAFVPVALKDADAHASGDAIPAFTNDDRGVVKHPEIEAVVICSSTDAHARLIEEAAQTGKHIFCEKPIALDLPSIDRALHAVESAGVKLQVGFNRRFDANFRRVRQAVEQAEIGQPQVLHIISRDPDPPPIEYIRVSGGLFLDMTIHDFDMARFLVGEEVEEVFAMAGALDNPAIGAAGDVDTAVVTLQFSNGVIGTISNSRHAAYGYDQRAELLGSVGRVRIDNVYPNTAIISDAHSARYDLPLHFFMERYSESFFSEMTAFVEAVLHDKPVPVSGYDGRMAAVLALAAKQSLADHRPVRLSEIQQ